MDNRTSPTPTEMAKFCDRAADLIYCEDGNENSELTDGLRAAARTLRAMQAPLVRTISPELIEMAEKVASTAGTVEPAEQWAERMAPAMAADPPSPPEDVLLAEIDAAIEAWYDGTGGRTDFPHGLLQRARERIAADAQALTAYAQIAQRYSDRIDAAEARAQRAEAAGMEKAAQLFIGYTFGPYKHPTDIIREHIAALARPEPERKT